MTVKEILDSVQQQATDWTTGREIAPDRMVLLKWLDSEYRRILNKCPWYWAAIRLNPAVSFAQGQRAADLPRNFGTNFLRYADINGSKYLCKLVSSTQETFLEYLPPAQFGTRNLSLTTQGLPFCYTVYAKPNGYKEMLVDPLPSTSYTITGSYIPVGVQVEDEDQELPLPGNSQLLVDLLLTRVFKGTPEEQKHLAMVADGLRDLWLDQANNSRMQFMPVKTKWAGNFRDDYTRMGNA